MQLDYLNDLPLTRTQKEKIVARSRPTPRALYTSCRAMPAVTMEWLEMGSLDELIRTLEGMLTTEDREAVQAELAAMGS